MIEFQPFPKLARLSRGCVITEKLDGTNAQIIIEKVPEDQRLLGVPEGHGPHNYITTNEGAFLIAAGSRTRLIAPGKTTDNFGFAAWVYENSFELLKLGEGRHFGEWYGQGIQRGYGLTEKRFALFNTHRWHEQHPRPACVSVVPIIHIDEFSSYAVNRAMHCLETYGSLAVPGFMNPEGIVVYHEASKVSFKQTFDDKHKEAEASKEAA